MPVHRTRWVHKTRTDCSTSGWRVTRPPNTLFSAVVVTDGKQSDPAATHQFEWTSTLLRATIACLAYFERTDVHGSASSNSCRTITLGVQELTASEPRMEGSALLASIFANAVVPL